MNETAGIVFIALGLAFNLFGCLGLVRLPDVYNRLQAATKCVTLGTCSILFGVFLIDGLSATGLKSLLSIFFLLLTAPVAAHAISRGSHRGGMKLSKQTVADQYENVGSIPAARDNREQAEDEAAKVNK